DFPDVGFSLEMLASVTLDGHAADQIPGHQLPDRGRNIRPREPEHRGDVLGSARPFRQVKQRMNLADRAVDAPLPAHVTPMQHEALGRARELSCFSVISVITEISEQTEGKSRGPGGLSENPCAASGYAMAPDWRPAAPEALTRRWGASMAPAAPRRARLRAASASRRPSRR